MSIHETISTKIISFLENVYYNNLKKLYNKNLSEVFLYCSFPVIKPDYFIFSQYYLIYLFLHYMTEKSIIKYTISLNMIYINTIIYDKLLIKYNYKPKNNVIYLKETSNLLFIYLLFFKLIFLKKLFLISTLSLFYLLMNINDIYKERLKSIENKEDFKHPLKILIFSPNKKFIEKIINKTRFFTFSNFILLTNVMIYIFMY